MSPTEPDIAGYAERIMTDIDDDIAGGALPASVRSFTDLHDYLDANDYLQAAGVPYDATPATIDVVVAVPEEVNRGLADPGRPYCTYGTCHYAKHDHTTTQGPDGQELDPPVPMRCNDCGQPAHYDEKLEDYRHDDPAAPDCFLIHRIHRAQPIPLPVDQLPVEAAFTTTHYPPGTEPDPHPLPDDLDQARAAAQRQASQAGLYPRSPGEFATYRWAVATREIRTKLGLAARHGERVLATRSGPDTVTFWSVRNQIATQVHASDITFDEH